MSDTAITHHYSDNVRVMFLVGAFIMTAMLPLFATRIPDAISYSVAGIVILCIAAGLSSHRYKISAYLNVIIALCSVVIFEQYAVTLYSTYKTIDFFFIVNQILALIFVASLYFAIKSAKFLADERKG